MTHPYILYTVIVQRCLWSSASGPMLQTPYYPAFISAAAWSPTRAGVTWRSSLDINISMGSGRSRLHLNIRYFGLNEVVSCCRNLRTAKEMCTYAYLLKLEIVLKSVT